MACIFQSPMSGTATIRASIVDSPGAADISVFAVNDRGSAHNDCLWFITQHQGQATSKIYFGSRGSAQLLVCFVSDRAQARWMRYHPLQNKL